MPAKNRPTNRMPNNDSAPIISPTMPRLSSMSRIKARSLLRLFIALPRMIGCAGYTGVACGHHAVSGAGLVS